MKRGGLVHSFQLAPPLWNCPSQALADTGQAGCPVVLWVTTSRAHWTLCSCLIPSGPSTPSPPPPLGVLRGHLRLWRGYCLLLRKKSREPPMCSFIPVCVCTHVCMSIYLCHVQDTDVHSPPCVCPET